MEVEKCILTGFELNEVVNIISNPLTINYQSKYSGIVKITHPAYLELKNNFTPNWILAGINLHNTLGKKEQILIDSDFIANGYKTYPIPKEFEEKCYLTLKGLYHIIGKENKTIDQGITKYSALGFTNYEEFGRILDQLISENFISCRNKIRVSGGHNLFMGISVSNWGKEKAKEMLPNIPMINLVDNSMSTGNYELDIKLNYAKDLFFKEPSSMENMRSACEQLSFILEPIREDLKSLFASKDVADFFKIVNTFDIRHNKESTKKLEFEEQLEWVFYTLLNTISTYSKLQKRLKSSS